MSKVVSLFPKNKSVVEQLTSLLELAQAGTISNFVFATMFDDGYVATACAGVSHQTRAVLNVHLQLDSITDLVEDNFYVDRRTPNDRG